MTTSEIMAQSEVAAGPFSMASAALAARGAQHGPAAPLQRPRGKAAHRILIIDQQHDPAQGSARLVAKRPGRRFWHGRYFAIVAWQVDAHPGALPEQTVNRQKPVRLADDPVHGGQPQASAALLAPGGEERLEDARQHLGRGCPCRYPAPPP